MVSAALAIGAVAAVTFVAAPPVASAAPADPAGPAWTCDAFGYLFQSPNGQDPEHQIIPVDLATGQPLDDQIVNTADIVNAAAYNTTDNYIYGWDLSTDNPGLVQVAADGTLTHLSVSGLPTGIAFNSGDIDSAGHYWMMYGGAAADSGTWAEIDLAMNSPTYGTVLAQGKFDIPATVQNLGADWGYVDGALYSAAQPFDQSPTTDSHLLKFDTTTHTIADLGPIPGLPSQTQDVTPGTWTNTAFGAAYVDAAGHVYFADNNSGDIFRVDVSDLQAADVAAGPQSKQNDGARCANAPIPTITVAKRVAGRVVSSDQFTVGLIGPDKDGNQVSLTSATTTGADTTVSTIDWPASQGKDYTITDAMAAGSQTTLSAYTPTIACTDAIGDTVTPSGSAPSWTLTVADATNYTCTITNTPVPSGPAWTCSPHGYLFQSPNGVDAEPHIIQQVDLATGANNKIGDTPDYLNAVGYNTLDNYIYGYDIKTNDIVRVASDGSLTHLGLPDGVPAGRQNVIGDFDDAGRYWMVAGATNDWYKIDYAPGSSTYGTVLDNGHLTPPTGVSVGQDWAFIDGAFYSIGQGPAGAATLVKFDPATGQQTNAGRLTGPDGNVVLNMASGAVYADTAGYLYASVNQTGLIYRVDRDTLQAIQIAEGPMSDGNDGARCANAPVPTITVTKDVAGRADSSDQFTVGLTGPDKNGDQVSLTSATTTGTDTTVSTTDWPVSANSGYTITDAMTAGSASTLADYTATISCVDSITGDTVATAGSAPRWGVTSSDGDPIACTVTNTPEPAKITVTKTVDPDDQSIVTAGQVLTYTLHFTNDGASAGTTDQVDDLSRVLDDATVTTDPAASSTDLTVGAISNRRFEVTGTIPGHTTYTVTYKVTVKPDGQRGDGNLDNFVILPHNDLPPDCQPGDPTCTHNPVDHLSIVKTASTTARPATGDTVSYTIVVTNDGQAAHSASDDTVTDDLSDVLDDATYNNDAAASSGTVNVAGDQLAWNGDLLVGQQVTITYSVTYTGSGNTVMANTACVPKQGQDSNCDTVVVPAADVVPSKSVDPDSGTTVTAGQTLTYTLTFDNQGEGAGDLDYTDYQAGILDDATITSGPTASNSALRLTPETGDALHITGTIPGNTRYTVTYTVTVNPDLQRGDNDLGNFLVFGPPPPPDHCDPASDLCTDNAVPEIVPSKSVDPASTTPVKAGQVLTYTLSFHNQGKGTGSLSYVDHLADVLDDATITSDPTASNSDVSIGTMTKDGDLPITVSVPAGATYTVTYQVTVKPDGQRGNDSAANFLTKPGQTPPDTCQPADPLCTINPMPEVHDSKTVAPNSGTPVVPGQVLTYTLHFTNKGTADGSVDKVDDITQAVDDAAVISQPKSSDPALSVTKFGSDHRASVTGTLEPGQKVTVTYQLKVSDPDTGDGVAANFLLHPEDPPPTKPDCTPSDTQEPDCTSNPVGSLAVSKTADPGSGAEVHPGDTITYTLHFANVGKGAVAVDEIDHLAGVLDDADILSQPSASSDALRVSKISHEQFEVTGSLDAGQSATVTYQVRTKPYDQQGDHNLGNFLDPPGVIPPAECVTGDPMCTVHSEPPPDGPGAPPVNAAVPPVDPAPAGGNTGLAYTGVNVQLQLILAGLLLTVGAVLTVGGMRRRRRSIS